MFFVSDVYRTVPTEFKSVIQKKTYEALTVLNIPFWRVETDEAVTMEDCVDIERKLEVKMVKTLFLCNRKETDFYLFVTAGQKPFKAKKFSEALNVSRVSFARPDLMISMMGTPIGAVTVFGVLEDRDKKIKVVFDSDVKKEKWAGFSDGTTTCYLKLSPSDIIETFLPYTKHRAAVIEI